MKKNNITSPRIMNKAFLTILTTILLFCSCQSTDKNSILEKNKEVVLAYHKVWNEGNYENLNDILTPDFVCHYLTSEELTGIEDSKKAISDWRALFPDWNEEIVDIIQENDKVVTRYKATATHTKR